MGGRGLFKNTYKYIIIKLLLCSSNSININICRTFREQCTDLLMAGFSAFKASFSIIIVFSSLIDNEQWRWNPGQLRIEHKLPDRLLVVVFMLVVALHCYSYNQPVTAPGHKHQTLSSPPFIPCLHQEKRK